MSDYDTVLERLLTDPAFSRSLAADPEGALAGYALSEDERRTLAAGISADMGRTSTVEQRTTKAGLVGVVGLVAEFAGSIGGPGTGGMFGDDDGDGIPNALDPTPQGSGGGQPATGQGLLDMFDDNDGDGIPNALEATPGDAVLVEFAPGASHEPVVVGQLYDDYTAPPTDAGKPLLTTIPMPEPNHPLGEDPPTPGQGHGHLDKVHPGHPDHPDDPPPSRG